MTPTGYAIEKRSALGALLLAHAPLLIAYSGGVDSAFLLAVAAETVGEQCLGVIADSPSLPRQALRDALDLAENIGARVEVIATGEMENPNYASNPINRCYFCKAELFARLDAVASARGFRAIAYGENADDAQQVRPGRKAAVEFAVLAPLKDVGLTKQEIRKLSRTMNLPTADAPSQPCLSSRIPYGTPVTAAALGMIERAEATMRDFGFHVFRVRHHVQGGCPTARVEILPEEMPKLNGSAERLCARLRRIGYVQVAIDPRGYRSPVS